MKTKELIRQLMESDPTGEEEVCVGNTDIHFVEAEPAYYDGALQVLVRDPDRKGYNIVGGKYRRNGTKIVIRTLSMNDVISNDPKCQIDYSELSEYDRERFKEAHEKLRDRIINLDVILEKGYFSNWVEKEAIDLASDGSINLTVIPFKIKIEEIAEKFFNENLSYDDPYPKAGLPAGHTYVAMRQMQWKQKLLFKSMS